MITPEEMQDDYNWQAVFEFAGKPRPEEDDYSRTSGNAAGSKPELCEGAECSAEPFDETDVKRVIKALPGEHDELDWIAVVELNDGRYAFLKAGCDYTGWDCQSGGTAWVSHSLENLEQFGVTQDARDRFAEAGQ